MSSSTTTLEHVQTIFNRQVDESPIYGFLFRGLDLKIATSGVVQAELVLEKEHVNSRGSLHGAVSAALVDLLGGLSIVSTGRDKSGASVDMHITYQATANVGDCIEITATCERLGRNLGFTRIKIAKQKGGNRQIVAAGTHTKFVGS